MAHERTHWYVDRTEQAVNISAHWYGKGYGTESYAMSIPLPVWEWMNKHLANLDGDDRFNEAVRKLNAHGFEWSMTKDISGVTYRATRESFMPQRFYTTEAFISFANSLPEA